MRAVYAPKKPCDDIRITHVVLEMNVKCHSIPDSATAHAWNNLSQWHHSENAFYAL